MPHFVNSDMTHLFADVGRRSFRIEARDSEAGRFTQPRLCRRTGDARSAASRVRFTATWDNRPVRIWALPERGSPFNPPTTASSRSARDIALDSPTRLADGLGLESAPVGYRPAPRDLRRLH